jgi:hypothetical protein
MQATAVTQATTVMPATSNILRMTEISWPLTTAGTQAGAVMKATTGPSTPRHQKQQCLQKQWSRQQHGERPTAAETIGTSQRQQQKGDPEKQGSQLLESSQQQYKKQLGCQQHNMDANSTIMDAKNLYVFAEICQKVIRMAKNLRRKK